MKPARSHAARRPRNQPGTLPASAPMGASPTIRAVEILWSENGAVPVRTFVTLWEADAALMHAATVRPPPAGGGYDKTGFRVTWTDGERHEGRLDISTRSVASGQAHGGMLRHHLHEVGRWLAGDDYLRMFTGRTPTDELERQRAWGSELLRRLERDARGHVVASRVRNASPTLYAGDAIPLLPETKAATAWLAAMPSPPTLWPTPSDRYNDLHRALDALFPSGRVNWADRRTYAFVNYLTHALRNDLPSIHAGDAAVIWKRWRDAVTEFRAHHDADYSVAMPYRSMTVAYELGQARAHPGSVFEGFCPWRSLYFDRDKLEPASVGHKPRRSRWEVDSWRS